MNRDSPQKKRKIQTMRQLCLQRKNQNFKNLKKWDQNRASKLIVHRKIVDQIDQSLQMKLAESNQYTKVVKQFFMDLLAQKNRYLTHQIQNPQSKIHLNRVGRNLYPQASKSLIRLYDSTQNSKQFNQVKKVLQESLNKIDQFVTQTQKQLMQLRTKYELLVLGIQDCNMQTLQKCDNLVAMYHNGKNLKAFQAQQDFFMQQQGFLYQANKQLQSQKALGMQVVQYFQFIQNREMQKLQLLKQLIGNYINCLKTENQVQLQHLINLYDILNKNTESKYFEEYFSVDQLLPRELVHQLAKVERKHQSQITMKYLRTFLKKFQYEQFDNRNLALKVIKVFLRGKASQETQKQNEQDQDQKQSLDSVEIYITVDGFINIYRSQYIRQQDESQRQQLKTLLYMLKISLSLVFKRISDIELEINVKKWGLMGFSQGQDYTIDLIFHSEDQREQFIQFISQLK